MPTATDPDATIAASKRSVADPSSVDETLASDGPGPSGDAVRSTLLERGDSLGRYLILDRLGAGAMGVVYAAYDPELDRKVAIKLLSGIDPSGESAARLLREAQALAKLSHPNVVAVHDAGTHAGRVFVAMELVDGATLRQWLAARDRTIPEILAVFLAAGVGLSAAHTAGLVHRDFKPDNVMIGLDGRVRVMDFGLARSGGEAALSAAFVPESAVETLSSPLQIDEPSTSSGRSLGESSTSSALELHLTRTGSVLGTPAYMSAEQFAGRTADARSDQFSFAVALYEALHGVRPFRGTSVAELAVRVAEGVVERSPPGTKVSAHLRKAVLRALASDPGARYPSMDALLAVLREDPGQIRRTRWIAGGIGLATLAAVAVGVTAREPAGDACEDVGVQLSGDWDVPTRERLAAAFRASGAPAVGDTLAYVEGALDDWASEWTRVAAPACRNQLSSELAALRVEQARCLSERRRDFHALVEAFADADTGTVSQAMSAVANLPDPARCADAIYLSAQVAPPENAELGAEVVRLQDELARAKALDRAGKSKDAGALIESLVDPVAATAYPPLTAEFGYSRGAYALNGDRAEDAEQLLYDSLLDALRGRDVEQAAVSARVLARTIGSTAIRHDEGLRWLDLARALGQQLGDDPLWLSDVASTQATIDARAGLGEAAQLAVDEAIRLRESAEGPDSWRVMQLLKTKAVGALEAGHPEVAKAAIERAEAIGWTQLGPRHPDLGDTYNTKAAVLGTLGDHQGARDAFATAIELLAPVHGDSHPRVLSARMNLGGTYMQLGQGELAVQELTAVRDRMIETLPPNHLRIGQIWKMLATTYAALGDRSNALAAGGEAMKVYEVISGLDGVDYAVSLGEHGSTLAGSGDARGAEELATAIEILETKDTRGIGPYPKLLELSFNAERYAGHWDRARRIGDKLIAIHEGDSDRLAEVHAGLALVELGAGEREAAERLVALADGETGELRGPALQLAQAKLDALAGRWDAVERVTEGLAAEFEGSRVGVDRVDVALLRTRAAEQRGASEVAERRAELTLWLAQYAPDSSSLAARVAALGG